MTRTLPSRLLLLTLAAVALMFMYDLRSYDTWLHLSAGRYIVQTGTIPRHDVFSAVAAGREWVNHSWLSAVILYRVHEMAGAPGLVLWRVAMMTAVALLLMLAGSRSGAHVGACAGVVLLACAAGREAVLARPVLFTFLLIAVFLWLPRALPRRPVAVALLLPALAALWCNLHAGVLLGLVVVAAHAFAHTLAADSSAKRWWLTLALCIGAAMANPFGHRVLTYPLKLAGMGDVVGNISEWLPPHWSLWHAPFVLMAALTLGAAAAAWRAGPRALQRPFLVASLLLAGLFGVMSLRVQRNMPVFALFAAVAALDGLGPYLRSRRAGTALWCAAAVVAGALICADRSRLGYGVARGQFPVQAMRMLKSNGFAGNVLSEYRWGGYIMWAGGCGPTQLRPVVDGRNEVYGPKLYREVGDVLALKPGWDQWLRDRDVHVLVFDRSKTGEALAEAGPWRLVHFDDVSVVWVRPTPATDDLVRRLDCTVLDPASASRRIHAREDLDRIERGLVDKLAQDPYSVVLTRLIGECALRRRDMARARDLFAACVGLDPRASDLRYHLAYCEHKLSRYERALAHYTAAIRLDPTKALYHFGLGQCLRDVGRGTEAEGQYRRAIALDAAFVPAYAELAELLARAGRVADAQQQVQAAAAAAGPDAARRVLDRIKHVASPQGGRTP